MSNKTLMTVIALVVSMALPAHADGKPATKSEAKKPMTHEASLDIEDANKCVDTTPAPAPAPKKSTPPPKKAPSAPKPKDADDAYQCADNGPKVVVTKLAKAVDGNAYKCTVDGVAIFTNNQQQCCPKVVAVAPTKVGPTAVLAVNCPAERMTCDLDGSKSMPGSSAIMKSTIDFGDGTSQSGLKASHTYKDRGTKTAMLTIENADKLESKDTKTFPVPGVQDQQVPPPPQQYTCWDGTLASDVGFCPDYQCPDGGPKVKDPHLCPPIQSSSGPWMDNLHLFVGPDVLGIAELPIVRPHSGQMIEAPGRLALDVSGGIGYIGPDWIVDLVLRGSPLVMEWAQDGNLGWQLQPSLMFGSEIAVQGRLNDTFAIGGTVGGLYQAVNMDYATGKSWISSMAITTGPRATWTVATFDPVKLDLIFDGFVGWDTQYGYKPDNKTLELWGTPMIGLSIGLGISSIGPPKGEESHLVEMKPIK